MQAATPAANYIDKIDFGVRKLFERAEQDAGDDAPNLDAANMTGIKSLFEQQKEEEKHSVQQQVNVDVEYGLETPRKRTRQRRTTNDNLSENKCSATRIYESIFVFILTFYISIVHF